MTQADLRNLDGSKHSLRQAIGRLDETPSAEPATARHRGEAQTPAMTIRWPLIVLGLALLGGGAAAALLLG